ncbi:MAG: hypothetical protein AB7O24_31995 [Kofleriaceae bacterium]
MVWFDRLIAKLRVDFGEPLDKSLQRRLRAAAPSTLSELREGAHCRVSGTVSAIDNATFEAPMSGRTCVAYALDVLEVTVSHTRSFLVIDRRGAPFVIADGDYRAVIDPAHAMLLTEPAYERRASSFKLRDAERALLARHVPDHDLHSAISIRIRERVIGVGDHITVAGTGTREADPQAIAERGYRDGTQGRLRFVGAPDLPLLIGRIG